MDENSLVRRSKIAKIIYLTILISWFLFLSPAILDTFLHKPTFLSDLISDYAIEVLAGILIWIFQAFGLFLAFIYHKALTHAIIGTKIFQFLSAFSRYTFFGVSVLLITNFEFKSG